MIEFDHDTSFNNNATKLDHQAFFNDNVVKPNHQVSLDHDAWNSFMEVLFDDNATKTQSLSIVQSQYDRMQQ